MTAASGVRRVPVGYPSGRDELVNVVRAIVAITLGAWFYLASTLDDPGAGRELLPFQALVANRTPVEQRMFRELQEGLAEAEAQRGTSPVREWPSIEALAAAGVPPFTPDPTRKAVYRWRQLQVGPYVNYLGAPEMDGPAWLVLIQEPTPGVPPDQTFEDEEHHRLADGTMLHVSTWLHPGGRNVSEIVRMPQSEGWVQLYAVAPGSLRPEP